MAPALLKAAIHVAIPKLRQQTEGRLPPPLTWADVEPAIRLIDSVGELEVAVEDPEGFLTRLLENVATPAAFKLAVARLRPVHVLFDLNLRPGLFDPESVAEGLEESEWGPS